MLPVKRRDAPCHHSFPCSRSAPRPSTAPAASGRPVLQATLFGAVLDRGGEQIELLLPIPAVAIEPDGGLEDWTGVEPAAADATAALLPHQPGPHQHLDVLGDRLQRHWERSCNLRDQKLAAIEGSEN